jgi:hypothetical protein
VSGRQLAKRGQRRTQALAFIRARENSKAAWTQAELAADLGISAQQAWSLLQSLAFAGELRRGSRVVVVNDSLVLAESR